MCAYLVEAHQHNCISLILDYDFALKFGSWQKFQWRFPAAVRKDPPQTSVSVEIVFNIHFYYFPQLIVVAFKIIKISVDFFHSGLYVHLSVSSLVNLAFLLWT